MERESSLRSLEGGLCKLSNEEDEDLIFPNISLSLSLNSRNSDQKREREREREREGEMGEE